MTDTQTHGKFRNYTGFCRMSYSLRNIAPLLIKSGDNDFAPNSKDMKFVRDSKGQIYIPGSTMKGFFRGNLDRLDKFIDSSLISENFGTQSFSSSMFFDDVIPVDSDSLRFESRSQIAIDRKTQGTKRGALMFIECLSAGALFNGSILLRNFNLKQLGLISAIIKLANDQIIKIGFNKTRGFGGIKISIDSIKIDIFDHKSIECTSEEDDLVEIKTGELSIRIPLKNKDEFKVTKEIIKETYEFTGDCIKPFQLESLNLIVKK